MAQQPSSPSGCSTKSMPLTAQHASIDSMMSPRRFDDLDDRRSHLIFTHSQSKAAPSRGISPRMHRNAAIIATNQIYNPASIERI